jgi:ankyrin repeat protein
MASFFCHGRGMNLQRSPSGVFRALLHQIIQQVPHLETEFEERFQARCKAQGSYDSAWDWTESELRTFLGDYLVRSCRDSELLIFVDALDECGDDSARELLDFFQGIVTASEAQRYRGLKICVSSRHYRLVRADVLHEIIVDGENLADIRTYVAQKLDSFREGTRKYDELLSSITSRAGEIFQWSVLVVARVIRSLEGKKPIETILRDIEETPQELFRLYHKIVRSYMENTNINVWDRRLFHDLFQWVALAKRPLSLRELEFALEVSSPTNNLNTNSAHGDWYEDDTQCAAIEYLSYGLMSVVEMPRSSHTGYDNDFLPRRAVQFVHHSIQEYFARGEGIKDLQDFESDPLRVVRAAELDIVRVCYESVLIVDSVPILNADDQHALIRDIPTQHPLLEYALEYIFEHARSAEQGQTVQYDLVRILRWPQHNCVAKLDRCLSFTRRPTSLRPLYSTRSLLHVAAAFDIFNLVCSILHRAPQTSINSRLPQSQVNWGGRTVLHIAAGEGSYDVVNGLLNLSQASIRRPRSTWWKHDSETLNVYARDDQGCTPLMRAAENGHIKIIELLAQIQYADLDTETRGLGYTALHLALNNGHIAAAKILVHRGASVRAKDYKHSTILFHALRYALYGPNATVRDEMFALFWELLPQVSKDLYWRDNSGDSPLKLGLTSSRSLEFAQVLLGRGLNSNAQDPHRCIWLSYLDDRVTPETLKLLLAQPGTDPDFQDERGQSLLARLVSSRTVNENLIGILLEDPRVHIRARDKYGRTPLIIAAREGSAEVVRAILADGRSNSTTTDKLGLRALDYAIERKEWCQDASTLNKLSGRLQVRATIKARVSLEDLQTAERIVQMLWIATFMSLKSSLSLELRPSRAQVWTSLLDTCNRSLFDERHRNMAGHLRDRSHLNVKPLAKTPSLSRITYNQTLAKAPYKLLS